MWYNDSVFYQIYPLGFCGALYNNDGVKVSRLGKVEEWIPHILETGCNAIYFSPLFESDYHGYDTRDYKNIDCRLGSNEDFKKLVAKLHANGIKVVIDGVFNHVGREFFALKDVFERRQESVYKDWFNINFDGNNCYNDGLWYEGWEGYYNLVKLNLKNNQVVEYLLDCVKFWIEEFDIDGIRLDVAYCLEHSFMERLRSHTDSLKNEFFLVGEMLHGDYNTIVNDRMLHSATNYECYKGLYSSFNSMNMYEISYSINRQFGSENWCLYRGKHLLAFVDNHDVNRIASTLTNKEHLPLIFGLMMTMPGIPCIYYGSEWGIEGVKENGSDDGLRPCVAAPEYNELTAHIRKLADIHKNSLALCYGNYKQLAITNKQYVFERVHEGEKVIVAINADSEAYTVNINTGQVTELLTGRQIDVDGCLALEPYSIMIMK